MITPWGDEIVIEGYAFYIGGAFLLCGAVMLSLFYFSLRQRRQALSALSRLEAAPPPDEP